MLALTLSASTAFAAADPIAHFRFDDGSGTTPDDSGPSNISAAFTGPNPTWTTDVAPVSFNNPYALNFTSTGDGVRIPWPSGLNFSANAPRSFSFWYKPTQDGENASGNFDRIVSWDDDDFEIAGTYGDVAVHRLAFYDGSWRDTGYDMSVGTWYNISFTYDGTNVKLYVSGDEEFSGTSAGRAVSGVMYVGVRYTGDEGINGIIDDFRVYDYALTSAQVDNIVAGSDDPDSSPSSSSSSAAGGGASMPVWLLNLRIQNNLTPLGQISSTSSSSVSSSQSLQSQNTALPETVVLHDAAPEMQFSSSHSSSASSVASVPIKNPFISRICTRLSKLSGKNDMARVRIHQRLFKRFGFACQ